MKTLWTFERSESIHPLNAAKPRTGLTKFEGDSIQHSIFENRKQHVASASVLLRNVCITSWTTTSSSLSSSIWILMMIESRVIEALFRSTLSLNQGSSSCRRPPNFISRLIGEEGGAIKFGNKIGPWLEKKLADQSNPENLRLDWSAGFSSSGLYWRSSFFEVEHLQAGRIWLVVKRCSWRSSGFCSSGLYWRSSFFEVEHLQNILIEKEAGSSSTLVILQGVDTAAVSTPWRPPITRNWSCSWLTR